MDGTQILTLSLGLEAPWILKDQHLDTSVSPHRLDLYVEAERGSLFPCPECGQACPAHDFSDKTWRHLNFFQHHCYLHARVPRTKCPEHGVKRIEVPWARPGSDFTLLFEQAAMPLVKEMPVLAVSRQLEISDKRLWRIVHHYVGRMLGQLDLSNVATVGVDETASRRGQRYVTVFLDMQRKQEPVIFAVPGHGKEAIEAFSAFLAAHGGDPDNVIEVVCDMSQAFLSGVAEHLPRAEVTVDWFHIVQTFTKRLDEVRKKEHREQGHPKSLRWALLKSLDNENLTPKQLAALQELPERHVRCLGDQGEAALDPEGADAASGPVAHHELSQGHEGGGLGEAAAEADGKGPGDPGAACRAGGETLDLGTDERTTGRHERPVPGGSLTRPGKTREKPLYDGLRSALPVGANVVL